jgi:hypothetical protein
MRQVAAPAVKDYTCTCIYQMDERRYMFVPLSCFLSSFCLVAYAAFSCKHVANIFVVNPKKSRTGTS